MHPDRLAQQDKYHLALYQTKGYSGLGKDRGVIASYALRHEFDKIVFIDNDMEWSWAQLKAIIDSDKKVIGGIAALKSYPIALNFMPVPGDKDCFDDNPARLATQFGLPKFVEKYKDDGTEIKVNGIGTAFLSIDVEVLRVTKEKHIAKPFIFLDEHTKKRVQCWDFFPSGPVDNFYFGEDWGACIQFQRAGFGIYANVAVQVTHIGDHSYRIGQVLGVME